MKVMCVNYGYKVHPETKEYVKEGSIYTVKRQFSKYSELAQRVVDVYEFFELSGYFECGMFVPLSNFEEKLSHCLKTKPKRKWERLNKSTTYTK